MPDDRDLFLDLFGGALPIQHRPKRRRRMLRTGRGRQKHTVEMMMWVAGQWGQGRSASYIADEVCRKWGVVWKPVTVYTRMHKAGLTGGRKWRGGMTLQVALSEREVEVLMEMAAQRRVRAELLLQQAVSGMLLEGPEDVAWHADRTEEG